MDTERNLLFGVVALQSGAVDAGGLAETCASWTDESARPLGELMVDRGLMTDEQRGAIEATVARELASHGDDPRAALAATIDGRSIEAMGSLAALGGLAASFGLTGHAATLAGPPTLDQTPMDHGSDATLPPSWSSSPPPMPAMAGLARAGHERLGPLSPGEVENRERYTLTHLHAKGGMGRVWLARDGSLGRQIALKDLRPEQTENSIVASRFLYEARITAQLEHPGIVPIYELGEGEAPYYTMRFVRGKTLSEAIRAYHKKRVAGEADSVGLNDLLMQFVGVCHAVAYAHSRGIIHRDLKGQNVVLGDFGEVIVLDWGLAKRVGPDPMLAQSVGAGGLPDAIVVPGNPPDALTDATCAAPSDPDVPDAREGSASMTAAGTGSGSGREVPESGAGPEGTLQGQLLGTPAYMAPEQAQGRHDLVDSRTDIYGLGAILYEILAGRPPFMAPKTLQLIKMVCNEHPTPPRRLVPEIAPALEAVCLKAMRKDMADRYRTASELAQEVRHYLADEPVAAFAEPWTMRARRWSRRHRTLVTAGAAGLLIVTIATAIGTMVVAGERDEARAQGEQARQAVHLLARGADIAFDDRLDPVQREILTDALAYYEKFTGRASNDPAVRLEHGRAFQQMGDFRRKLGDLDGSEKEYLKAIEKLEPVAADDGKAGLPARQTLARTRTLLADLLVRRGTDKGRAYPLLDAAEAMQVPLAEAKEAPAEDLLRLGQTLRSRADLLRLDGRSADARPSYDRAVAMLRQALDAATADPVVRNELALAIDERGWLRGDLGDLDGAEADYRSAIGLLEKLVTEFPTVARHREVLAKSYNSLGVLEEEAGRLADAETHYRRELPMVERLAQDYPDRPEHHRQVARTLYNLGNILSKKHDAEAKAVLVRAVAENEAVAARAPEDVPIRLSLARAHQCLGDVQYQQMDLSAAVASIAKARAISEGLVNQFPEKPRYSELLAMALCELGTVQSALGQAIEAEKRFADAATIYQRLVAADPANVPYRIGQARCLSGRGAVVAGNGRAKAAEEFDREALAILDPLGTEKTSGGASSRVQRLRAAVLTDLGVLHRAGAEDSLQRSIAIFRALVDREPTNRDDRHSLAIAENNLADLLVSLGKIPEAGAPMAAAVAEFDRLVIDSPRAADYRSQYGEILDTQAHWLDRSGRTADAELAMEKAVEQAREAVKITRGASPFREQLGRHLIVLADIERKLGDYEKATKTALEIPRAVPDRARPAACLDAAKLLARTIARAGKDTRLSREDLDRINRKNLGRTVVLLREAIDGGPELAGKIKNDPDLEPLRSRPEFVSLLDALVDRGS